MIIMGIDPGIATIGYGIINYSANKFTVIDYGVITTEPNQKLDLRLCQAYDALLALIDKYKPEAVSVEELFFNTNVKTAIAVGHGRGVILLCARKSGVEVFEYTPLQVKQAVVGYGRAEKRQVMEMTKVILNLEKIPRPDDAADGLALAICHAHSSSSKLFLV